MNSGYEILNDTIIFSGNNLLVADVTDLPVGWTYTTSSDKIVVTPPFGSQRTEISFRPTFTKNGVMSYTDDVKFTSSIYININALTPTTTNSGDIFTFTGSNLSTVTATVNGWETKFLDETILAIAPLGSVRESITFTPTFQYLGTDISYGKSITYISSAYVNIQEPYYSWNSLLDQFTLTGVGLNGAEVTNIQGWSYTSNNNIIVQVPLGSLRKDTLVYPNISKVGLLDFGKSISLKSTRFVNSELPTKTTVSSGEIFTFKGFNLSDTLVSNISTWSSFVSESEITVSVPLGTVRATYE